MNGSWYILRGQGTGYAGAYIRHTVLAYYEQMADLYAASDLVIGRSGAVSVAEYVASGVPSICMPYPYHKDRHQYLNAKVLADAGASVIVDDVPNTEKRAELLWQTLETLLTDQQRLAQMAAACKRLARPQAASRIAELVLSYIDTSLGLTARP